jgi:hypothetical protein
MILKYIGPPLDVPAEPVEIDVELDEIDWGILSTPTEYRRWGGWKFSGRSATRFPPLTWWLTKRHPMQRVASIL